jgi:hypothetical protein
MLIACAKRMTKYRHVRQVVVADARYRAWSFNKVLRELPAVGQAAAIKINNAIILM